MPRLDVRAYRIAPAADLIPRMRGHVVDVARARDRPPEELGALLRPPGHDRRLGGMDIEVAGAGMMDVFRQDLFEDVVQPLHRRAVHVARAAPRLEQEQRVAVERDGVEVVRVLFRELPH